LQNHKKVIPFSHAEQEQGWRFFDYLENEQNVIEPWYRELSETGQDTFDGLLKLNAKTPLPMNWGCSKALKGEYKQEGIWEWRFFSNDRQQRIVGVFGAARKAAIFLIGCSHKGKVYTPPKCLDTALRRAKEVRKGAMVEERTIEQNL
jgi:hypothetical protein